MNASRVYLSRLRKKKRGAEINRFSGDFGLFSHQRMEEDEVDRGGGGGGWAFVTFPEGAAQPQQPAQALAQERNGAQPTER